MQEGRDIWNINTYYENDNYIFFTYRLGSDIYSSFINKATPKVFSSKSFTDDVFVNESGLNFSSSFMPEFIDDNFFYVVVEPYYLVEDLGIKELTLNDGTIHSVSVEDNPIIIKYRLK